MPRSLPTTVVSNDAELTTGESGGRFVLHLFTLSLMAVGEPLFDLLGKFPEFLAVRESSRGELLFLAATLVVLPALPWLALCAVSWRSRFRSVAIILPVAVFGALVASRWAILLFDRWSGPLAVGSAAVAGILLAYGYRRLPLLRTFVSFLSWSLMVVPLLFWFHPRIAKLRAEAVVEKSEPLANIARVPIVWLIFDELPFSTLVDENGEIERERFPHLAALADTSHWFLNASSVNHETLRAVPALLTGRRPARQDLPMLADHPRNLFSYLGATHSIFAVEPVTALCPKELNRVHSGAPPSLLTGAKALLSDLGVVYLHLVTPAPYDSALPTVSEGWGEFVGTGVTPAPVTGGDRSMRPGETELPEENDETLFHHRKELRGQARAATDRDRAAEFREFVQTIDRSHDAPLYFAHVLLPHIPWVYSPTGKLFSHPGPKLRGIRRENRRWASHDPWAVHEGYQRHLLQVRFLDRLIGELVDRLRAESMFDDALIVLTADHGASFRAGENRRKYSSTNAADIMTVPLLIKAPGQVSAEHHTTPLSSLDVLPTVFELLGAPSLPSIDGRSAVARDFEPVPVPQAYVGAGWTEIGREIHRDKYQAVAFKHRLFGDGSERFSDFDLLQSRLVGKKVSELRVEEYPGALLQLSTSAGRLGFAPEASTYPGRIVGTLRVDDATQRSRLLVLALNGTVAATREVPLSSESQRRRFSVLLPEQLFAAGDRNRLEFFLLEDDSGLRAEDPARAVVLHRIRSEIGG